MYATQARVFIRKLIRMQQEMERKGLVRHDQPAVRHSREHMKLYLDYYRYDTDQKMRGFFARNIDYIRTLLPGDSHPGFKKLMDEFISLKD